MSIPRPEYPRPDLVRDSFINLNGEWEFEIDQAASGKARKLYESDSFSKKIIVPFVPESKLSGIEYLDFMKSVWYRRTFTLPADWDVNKGRVLIHFGAVDYVAEVWINNQSAGTHQGGYTPFVFDITKLLVSGENSIIVNAFDDVCNSLQPTGKQCEAYDNHGCMYTRSTGIWQTVWMEYVPDVYVKRLKITPDVDNSCVHILVKLNKPYGGNRIEAVASLDGAVATSVSCNVTGDYADIVLPLTDVKLWEVLAPVLYDLEIKVGEDIVKSYFGMRKIEINGYAVEINGNPVYQRLVLDQQYYPDGIYTAPTDDDLKNDILLSIDAGFNGARMHMKVFEPRFIYWADKLGYILWGEYPNWGSSDTDFAAMHYMLPEWVESLERDYNHPSIVGWCPFNETTIHRSKRYFESVYEVTKAIDTTRPVIDTSGYIHASKTDIYDVHDYEQDVEKFKEHYETLLDGRPDCQVHQNNPKYDVPYAGQPYFVSEFGGIYWNVDEVQDGWGYGAAPKTLEEFYTRYEGMVKVLLDNPKMCAFCYTQITDVQQEKNGIYTYDRRKKFDVERIRAANMQKAAIEK